MSRIAYVRVSTKEQTVENQLLAIKQSGHQVDRVFSDEATSGSTKGAERVGFKECFQYLREGDTLVVYAIDRLGRSTLDVLNTIQSLVEKRVGLIVIQQGFDTSTSAGKLALTMFSAFAEFENGLRRERQMLGIQRAKEQGRLTGRPRTITDDDVKKAKELIENGVPKAQVARSLKIDRSSLYRVLNTSSKNLQ